MSGFLKKKYLISILLIILIVLVMFYILPVSVPLIVAFITALMLDPLTKIVQAKFKLKRQLSIIIVFTLFTLLLGSGIFFIVTKVIGEGIKLIEDTPIYINNLTDMWHSYEEHFQNAAKDFPEEVVTAFTEEANNLFETFKTSLKQYVNIEKISAFLSYIPNYLVSFLVYLIALFMFMIDLPRIRSSIYEYMTEKTSEKVSFMTSRLSSVVFGFFKAQFFVSIIIMIAAFIGLILIAPKVAIVMTLIIWIIDLIPIIGSIVILAPWSLYHLLTGNIALGTKLAILAVILLIIRRTVEPKVMGTHMGLSPLSTLISMYLGLKLLGVLGLILGPTLLIVFKSAKEAGLIKMNFKI
ncbi:sporulation integral membrane protein YtvI [Lederbergia citrea]|uniref:Sporulation integral membrane protein YtvI n=1 Tax=Lederbergia citrea TaxID=2833581 RepID=A0A942Z482_9BACI|nr:sporulation integral membrane protein YtvI [Lederbergia citrea]MBS4203909.1 sporulation integral membrane protein YtvI [Lederbergia citrea]MBS4221506.1 sporulation integral membrane protein YtvI [Lederbergia citrea]